MKRLTALLAVLGIASLPALAITFNETPDIPTDLGTNTYMPWDVVRDSSGIYSLTLSLPANTAVDSLHGMCTGEWLISVEGHGELPAGSGTLYAQADIIRYDGSSTYNLFFCGGPIGIPAGSDIDAAFLIGDDNSDLVISFDVPTDLSGLGGGIYDPSDLVRFVRTAATCSGWTLVGTYFDASTASPAVPLEANITGADLSGGSTVFTFDVPTTLGGTTYLPGTLVLWDGSTFATFYSPAYPAASRTDGFSFLPGPGTMPPVIEVDKSAVTPGDIEVSWLLGGPPTAEDYAVYEGTIGSWYSHTSVVCTDTGNDLKEEFTPQTNSSYYLVVPLNADYEGSYGTDSTGAQRPQGTSPCRSGQDLSCP